MDQNPANITDEEGKEILERTKVMISTHQTINPNTFLVYKVC